jgi:hypothetical protein
VRALRASHQSAPAGLSFARICFCALLATPTRFQLYENWFPAPDDQLIREAAPHTPLLLKDTGKDPDFWCAFEDGKVTVIGDEPANTDCDPDPSEKAVS